MTSEGILGATHLGNSGCRFVVWAPLAGKVEVHVVSPQEKIIPLDRHPNGYHEAILEGVPLGSLYLYRLDCHQERPDPASRLQPKGVHGPSQVVDRHFPWQDSTWFGLPMQDYIIYELHVGTFTPEGHFDAIIGYLDELRQLGITAIEIMPVAEFPGNRNWGYDGVYPFAVHSSYGGPTGLKRLVDACHRKGISVILDVVYNHLGPEGNYLRDFGPYFTEQYHTPWGPALNFDGPHSDEVRRYFIENALSWVTEFHIDALRIDAVHGIMDRSAQPFLQELAVAVHKQAERLNRRVYLIAESDLEDTRLIRHRHLGGYGLDAQWNDDFHHCIHALLTGERTGYYQDFGHIQHLVKAFHEGFVYSGQYSEYRRRRHGNSSRYIPAHRFVVFTQNHDQIGNRMLGERLSQLVSFEGLKLAAGLVVLSPFIPLLFMGEEYGETAPFPYFTSHSDPNLVQAVRQGRQEEFASFQWQGAPQDPQDEAAFLRAKINHPLRQEGQHQVLTDFYKKLIRLRKEISALTCLSKDNMEVLGYEKTRTLLVRRWSDREEVAMAFNLNKNAVEVAFPLPAGQWSKLIDSADKSWKGTGSLVPTTLTSDCEVALRLPPLTFVLLVRKEES